ncbi:MAG: radical SAM protein [Chitinivibrionales bacterium]|nr:radical SAM protein [Chitinivibrionales bacterium]
MAGETVLFVEPRGAESNVFSHFMGIPLLGPVYLATMARDHGYAASVFNENVVGREIRDDELAEADWLCLSCLTATADRGKQIARRYHAVRRDRGLPARSAIGGIHASMMPDDVAPHFDHVAVGEGESILLDLLSGRVQTKVVEGKPVDDLDTLPLPDFGLVRKWKPNRVWPVMTSRGCPFDCNFCSVTEMFGRGYRSQSPERVMREISRYKQGYVFFADDNFTVDIKRSLRLMELMESSGFDLDWGAQVRTDTARRQHFVQRMRETGCTWVFVGLESVNPESLADMGKAQTVEDVRRSVEVFHSHNIRVHGMFILGSDPESVGDLERTAAFARECRIDTAQFNVLTPLPGTRLFSRIVSEGRLLHRDWRYFDGLHVVFMPKRMSPLELQRGMICCFEDFYTYASAVNEALNTFGHRFACGVRTLFVAGPQPRGFEAAVMKAVGHRIVKRWVVQNRSYVEYLAQRSRDLQTAPSA